MSRPKRLADCHHCPHYGLGLCMDCYHRQYKQTHKNQTNKQQRVRYKQQLGKSRPYYRQYAALHPQQEMEKRIKWRYGMTNESYAALLDQQHGVCAICKRAPMKIRLAVDHDHSTNKVRGLLCRQCNAALGLLQDNPKILIAASKYVLETT